MVGYMLHMNLEQLTWVLFRAIYMHARVPLSLTKTGPEDVDVASLVFAIVTCETRIFYCPVKKLIELF